MAEDNVIRIEDELTQNDIGVIFALTAKDKFGNILDLTDTNVFLNIKRGRDSSKSIKVQCSIVDAQYGRLEYITQDGDLSIGGTDYEAEVEINYPDGAVITSQQTIEFHVKKEIR